MSGHWSYAWLVRTLFFRFDRAKHAFRTKTLAGIFWADAAPFKCYWRPYSQSVNVSNRDIHTQRRLQRDIPMPLVSSGVEHGNLRELALARMKDLGTKCRDVRTREVGIQEIHNKVWSLTKFSIVCSQKKNHCLKSKSKIICLLLWFVSRANKWLCHRPLKGFFMMFVQ